MDTIPRRFRYFADPICIACLIIYPINRWYLKPHHIGGWFTHGYLNDVMCLPLFLPMILYGQRLIGLRRNDDYPRWWGDPAALDHFFGGLRSDPAANADAVFAHQRSVERGCVFRGWIVGGDLLGDYIAATKPRVHIRGLGAHTAEAC